MEFLYNIFIYPIYALIEVFSNFANTITFGFTILCIAAVSFLVNLVCLPLYMRAEAIQKEEKDIQKKLEPMVKQIKRNFKGNERFMLLSTYYRQNNYHPIMSLRPSISLLLQIAFFFAAYTFFSKPPIFPPNPSLFDFYAPDGLLLLFGHKINILPILMTAINLLSAEIYTRKINSSNKVQMYSFAFIFLVLLYNSPSGLVIYWTMNNFFSLLKNIGLASKSPKKFLFGVLIVFVSIFLFYSALVYSTILNPVYITFAGICIIYLISEKFSKFFERKPDVNLYLMTLFGFCTFAGLLCTTNVIASSPLEFSTLRANTGPLYFVFDSSTKFIGVFFWLTILYYLSNDKMKNILTMIMCGVFASQIINILTFANVGLINQDMALDFSLIGKGIFKNTLLTIACAIVPLIFIILNKTTFLKKVTVALIISAICFSGYKAWGIEKTYNASKDGVNIADNQWFKLSKNNKNVLILMLDAGMGIYVREAFEKNEDFKNHYKGFVFYPNTISYYGHTIISYPAMIGGYEYTPYNMNKRKELMENKYNESTLVLPTLFKNKGYDTTIINPRMANFEYRGNSTVIFDTRGIKSFYTQGFVETFAFDRIKDNFFYFDIFSSSPSIVKKYMVPFSRIKNDASNTNISNFPDSMKKIRMPYGAVLDYKQLTNLKDKVKIANSNSSFVVYHNDLLHYDKYGSDYSEEYYILHEESLRTLGDFFDYLRKNNVYDNTRIIIVSDHGRHRKKNKYNLNEKYTDYNPILMFKDFNDNNDFKIDDSFMTNADCAIFALENIIKPAINPYTGKNLKDEIDKKDVYIITDGTDSMVGNYYSPIYFQTNKCIRKDVDVLKVKDNIFDDKNWKKIKNDF